MVNRSWRDCWGVNSTYCPHRGPEFGSQDPGQVAHNHLYLCHTEIRCSVVDFPGSCAHMYISTQRHTHTCVCVCVYGKILYQSPEQFSCFSLRKSRSTSVLSLLVLQWNVTRTWEEMKVMSAWCRDDGSVGKMLAYKCEEIWVWILSTHVKRLDVVLWAPVTPALWRLETRRLAGACWLPVLLKWQAPGSMREPCLKSTKWRAME